MDALETVMAVAVLVAGIGLIGWDSLRRRRRRLEALDRAAQSMGFERRVVRKGENRTLRIAESRGPAAVGRLEGLTTVVDIGPRSRGRNMTSRVWVDLSDWIPDDLHILPRRGPLLGGKGRFVTGDPEIDRVAHLTGPEGPGLALLGAEGRSRLCQRLREGRIRIRDGTLMYELPGVSSDAAELEQTAREAAHLASSLDTRGSVEERLLAHARNDPVEGVRTENLRCLLTDYADSDEARRAEPLAAEHPDDAVRRLLASAKRGGLSVTVSEGGELSVTTDSGGGELSRCSAPDERDSS
jgi:hypothetical protein